MSENMIFERVRDENRVPFGCVVALWDEENQRVVIGAALHRESKQVEVNEKSLGNVEYIIKRNRNKGITRRINIPWNRDRIRQIAINRAFRMGEFDRDNNPKNFPRIKNTMSEKKRAALVQTVDRVRERAYKQFKQVSPEEILSEELDQTLLSR